MHDFCSFREWKHRILQVEPIAPYADPKPRALTAQDGRWLRGMGITPYLCAGPRLPSE